MAKPAAEPIRSSVTRRAVGTLLCGLLSAACLFAQGKPGDTKKEAWRIDPYTGGDAEAAKKIGIESYGPFAWTDDHTTADIEKAIGGGVALHFTETAHFKLGTALPSFGMPVDKDKRTWLLDEIKRLQKKLPKFNPDAKTVDSWLRHHLFEQRLEDFYADFTKRLALDTATTPYLGLKGKFLVLLTEKESSMGRYAVRYLKQEGAHPFRHYFATAGSMFYGSAIEYLEGPMRSDTGLWCQTIKNVAHNFVAAFKGYSYQAPVWFEEGLAHWYERRIDPGYNTFSVLADAEITLTKEWDWKPKVRSRVAFDNVTKCEVMMAWKGFEEMKFADHLVAWSRVEWLMSQGDDRFAVFMDEVKGKAGASGPVPTPEEVQKLGRNGLMRAWGLDAKAFDEQWKKHVLATYPLK